MLKNSSLEVFEEALRLLDEKLNIIGGKTIEIKAIGGFAMMYYGIRQNGYTIDIDSLTNDYDEKVRGAVKEVGQELDIDEDWLNTDCAMLDGFLGGLSEEISWTKSKYSFRNIDLKIADIVGLIRSKAKAINDSGVVPRSTDKKDLLALLKSLDIKSIKALDASDELVFIKKSYPRCYDYLNSIENW